MDILEAIHRRRSTRKYTGQAITDEEIRIMLDAAMTAPSAGNARPWQFVVVDDTELLGKIAKVHQYIGMADDAPLGILVCGDPTAEKHPGFWVQDCSAAVQNLLLAATGLGIGTVWTGVYPLEERVTAFRQICSIPEHIVPMAYIVVGRPAKEPESLSRYDADKVFRNTWQTPGFDR